jgi:hypothetical protein
VHTVLVEDRAYVVPAQARVASAAGPSPMSAHDRYIGPL